MTEQTGGKTFSEQLTEAILLYTRGKLTAAAFRARMGRLIEEDPQGYLDLKARYDNGA